MREGRMEGCRQGESEIEAGRDRETGYGEQQSATSKRTREARKTKRIPAYLRPLAKLVRFRSSIGTCNITSFGPVTAEKMRDRTNYTTPQCTRSPKRERVSIFGTNSTGKHARVFWYQGDVSRCDKARQSCWRNAGLSCTVRASTPSSEVVHCTIRRHVVPTESAGNCQAQCKLNIKKQKIEHLFRQKMYLSHCDQRIYKGVCTQTELCDCRFHALRHVH